MRVWSSKKCRWRTGPCSSYEVWREGLLVMALIAIRKGIQMWVVEKAFVAISPRETLQEHTIRKHTIK